MSDRPDLLTALGRLELTAKGTRQQLVLDGVDISNVVRNTRLDVPCGEIPRAVVDVVVFEGVSVGVEAVVFIPPETADLLIRYGWTPPNVTKPRSEAADSPGGDPNP